MLYQIVGAIYQSGGLLELFLSRNTCILDHVKYIFPPFKLKLMPLVSVKPSDATLSGSMVTVPGTVISQLYQNDKKFVGSPSIVRLPDGALVASHDLFGPASSEHELATTRIFRSEYDGAHWAHIASVEGAFWSNLFVYEQALYLMGMTHHHGLLVIRRSEDGGKSWTTPGTAGSRRRKLRR